MTVYLVRHGRTDANGETYAGRAEIPLNETGRMQALTLVRDLAGQPIDRILCSPLQRARDTAAPLARVRNLPAEIVPALTELDFGDLQGKAKTTLAIRKAHLFARISGGESLCDVWRRLAPVADQLRAAERDHLDTVVVAHFWTLRLLSGLLRNTSIETAAAARDFRLRNGAFSVLHMDGTDETGESDSN